MIQLVQVFNCLKGSIGSRVQLVKFCYWFNNLIGSIGSIGLRFQASHWLKDSIGSRVQLVQGFNWFKGSSVQWIPFFNWWKVIFSIDAKVQLV